MTHLGRVHGVAMAWLHELSTSSDVLVAYASSKGNAADIFTKAFGRAPTWETQGRVSTYSRQMIRCSTLPYSLSALVLLLMMWQASPSLRTSFAKGQACSRWPHSPRLSPTIRGKPLVQLEKTVSTAYSPGSAHLGPMAEASSPRHSWDKHVYPT